MLFRSGKCGRKIFCIEKDYALGSPRTAGVGSIAPRLILEHHHINRYILLGISIDKLSEIVGISLQIARLHYEIVVFRQFRRENTLGSLIVLAVNVGLPGKQKRIFARVHIVGPVGANGIVGCA